MGVGVCVCSVYPEENMLKVHNLNYLYKSFDIEFHFPIKFNKQNDIASYHTRHHLSVYISFLVNTFGISIRTRTQPDT